MNVSVHIPPALRIYCGGARNVSVSGSTVREVLVELEKQHRAVYVSVCDETGAVRRHINVFVNDELSRTGDALDAPLAAGDDIFIIPAVSGG